MLYFLKDKWADILPTIVSKAKTIQVFDVGSIENHSGALRLVCFHAKLVSPKFTLYSL